VRPWGWVNRDYISYKFFGWFLSFRCLLVGLQWLFSIAGITVSLKMQSFPTPSPFLVCSYDIHRDCYAPSYLKIDILNVHINTWIVSLKLFLCAAFGPGWTNHVTIEFYSGGGKIISVLVLYQLQDLEVVLNKWTKLRRMDLTGNPLCHKPKYRDRIVVQSRTLGKN